MPSVLAVFKRCISFCSYEAEEGLAQALRADQTQRPYTLEMHRRGDHLGWRVGFKCPQDREEAACTTCSVKVPQVLRVFHRLAFVLG